MIGWFKLDDETKKTSLTQASLNSTIQAKAIEKDWWVTLVLKALYESKYSTFLSFKGGTSLSKCWNLIHRFSEDIDISLAPEALDLQYQVSPSKRFVSDLRRRGCAFTTNELRGELEMQIQSIGIPKN